MGDTASLISDLQQFDPAAVRIFRCQVDVKFPRDYEPQLRLKCPWYVEFGGRPQIVEVAHTGWEIYHFESLESARKFADTTRERLPVGALVQLRAAIEIESD